MEVVLNPKAIEQSRPGPHIPALSIRKNRYAVVNEPLTA